MARTVPLDPTALAWARRQFARYYGDARLEPPARLARREFAAFPFATEALMRRHATLRTPEELSAYLAREVPRHVYYSSAYYRQPSAPTMAAKEWLGADLIFDLDADHLRGAEAMDYPGQLALVKRRLIALVDDFLFGDFGIDPASTSFVFSGGRGYHVHVRDERFLPLSSPERRELVDYVLGTGVDPLRAIEEHREDVRAGRTVAAADDDGMPERRRRAPPSLRLVPPETPGWRGRTTRAVLASLARWQAEGADAAVQEMTRSGVDAATARLWARRLVEKGGASQIESTLALDVFKHGSARAFVEKIVPQAAIEVQGETDAPVTTDIHRLIRLPGSLHGGTGFRVVPLSREEIGPFEPFSAALVPASGEEGPTPVVYTQEARYPFADETVHARPGATDELPTPVALFLVLRGEAALRPSPG